jgi:hypothetical protein
MHTEHTARLDTNGCEQQTYTDSRLKLCLSYCDRVSILLAGILIGLLSAWSA